MNILVCLGVFLLGAGVPGCKKKASPEEIAAAKKVLEKYNEAWLRGDTETLYRLSTVSRIKDLTDVDPRKGAGHEDLARKRFFLIAEQTKEFLGYARLDIEEVAGSKPGKVLFKVKARHKKGSRVETSNFLRKLVKKKNKWLLD